MIPVRLALKNFMSYRDPCDAISFAPLHTACLSGENGAGKSALLTAMTWGLWGIAQSHADDEDLITQGETEMAVDFEFALGAQHYRVLRTRSRKGKTSRGTLFFQILDPHLGWRDITDGNLRQTQQAITQHVGMDYDTFVNSAFLRQGHADEFTTKNSTERKDILARILGLNRYDDLAERAREQARAREADRRELLFVLKQLDEQISRKAELQALLSQVETYLAETTGKLVHATSEAEKARRVVAGLEQQELELANVKARAAQDEIEISKAQNAIKELEANLIRYRETLAQGDHITTHYTRLQALRVRERELNEVAHQSRELEGEVSRLERVIAQARTLLQAEIGSLQASIRERRKEADKQPAVEAGLGAVRAELETFAKYDIQLTAARAEFADLKQAEAAAAGRNDKLKEEADALHGKLAMLNQALEEAAGHAAGKREPCPLCGVLLDTEAIERVRASYQADIAARRRKWKENAREQEALQRRAEAVSGAVAELEQKLKGRSMAERREAALERDLQAALAARDRAAADEAALAERQARLDRGDYAAEERDELVQVRARLAALAYDAAVHRAVSQESSGLSAYESRMSDLRLAEDRQASDTTRLAQERESLVRHQARAGAERAQMSLLAAAVADLAGLRQQLLTSEAVVQKERIRFNELSREQAAKERELEGVAAAETDRAIRAAELTRATAEKGIYDDLARAFGKGGIQAMIIEQVVPELAEEANSLLGAMTDDRMHLSFETQKQAKTKDSVIETLDIKITDGAGIARKYEMYSGGEAFRINFAVRIALSKLLARRAGAQLQTLIIDEGFGTQDAQGRERLVQAIRSIQKDFEKILVITHIDELKDEFASRIDVVKTARGSSAVVT
jgi:DNA repair protein SbcC/Rad50